MIPEQCDYLVVGGGATGMAFVDTLLKHSSSETSVVLIDKHGEGPGGQWQDSYNFVRLHQPSSMYGVESEKLEPNEDGISSTHRATREEIIEYYEKVVKKLEAGHDFHYLGGMEFDFSQLSNSNDNDGDSINGKVYVLCDNQAKKSKIRVSKRLVDARYLQPDLPVFIPPKFSFDPSAIQCAPVNDIFRLSSGTGDAKTAAPKNYVVIGGGKTGMDAIVYLLTKLKVDPDRIMWVVPNEAWITAREKIGNCMEFLHNCSALAKKKQQQNGVEIQDAVWSEDFFQSGFMEWERQGKVYRFDNTIVPTKFKDATLSKDELNQIKIVKRVVRNGRVREISNQGDLIFADGTSIPLPWKEESSSSLAVSETMFVHCSAGAFNYSKNIDAPPPVFGTGIITIQDVYGTPGFCMVGSVVAFLESLSHRLSDEEKNAMCLHPTPDAEEVKRPLGPSGGDVGVISSNHGLVQRMKNLKMWLQDPEIRPWLYTNRLFNLGHQNPEQTEVMIDDTWKVLADGGVVEKH